MAVRRERVLLELEDHFTGPMAKAAAETALLRRELDGLSGNAVRSHRPLGTLERDVDKLGTTAQRRGAEIDKLSGRMRIFADAAAVFGPSLAPLGAAGIGALAGFSNQLGMAASAAGVAVLAFHGVGDAVSALNTYHLEPTSANLQKVNQKLEALAPAAQKFARTLSEAMPAIERLQQTAAAGMFPGLTDALHTISSRGPAVNAIVGEIASAMGELAKEGAEALSGPGWDAFFENFEATAKPTLLDMGHALGNVAKAAADLWVAFSPLTTDFSGGLVNATRDFEQWTASLSRTEGFQNFLAYIEQSGPQVLHLLGQLGNMFVSVARAVAPLGGPSMKILGALADAISNIADSDVGTPILAGVAALALFNRALAVTDKLQAATFGGPAVTRLRGWGGGIRQFGKDLSTSMTTLQFTAADTEKVSAANERLGASFKSFGKGALAVGALGFAASGLADKAGLAHASMGAMLGMMAGPEGAVIGATAGTVWDLVDAIKNGSMSQEEWERSINHWTPAATAARDRLDAMNIAAKQSARGLDLTSAGALAAAQSIKSFTAAIEIANNRLSDRADIRAYQQSLDDFTKSVEQNGRTLNINTQKGRDNQAALDNIASTALKVAENLKGMDRVRYLQRARSDFIDAAQKVGLTRGAAIKLANELHLVDLIHAKPKITLDAAGVKPQLDAIWGVMDKIVGTHNATLHYSTTGTPPRNLTGLLTPHRAAGGRIVGPGTGTSDSILSRVSNGEYVVRAAAVDRYGVGLFDALNAERFAAGGRKGRDNSWKPSAAHAFDLTGDMSIKALENEFWTLAHTVKTHGGHLGDAFASLEKRAKALNGRWDAVSGRLDKAKDSLDALRSERDALRSSVGDSLTSNPFAMSNVWASPAAGAQGILGTLRGDIANAHRFNQLSAQLKKHGVHGEALAAAQEQGVGALAQLAGLSVNAQHQYQHLFDQRATAVGSAQHTAAMTFKPLIDAQAHHVERLEKRLKAIEKAVNRNERAVERSAHVTGREVARGTNRSAAAGAGRGRS